MMGLWQMFNRWLQLPPLRARVLVALLDDPEGRGLQGLVVQDRLARFFPVYGALSRLVDERLVEQLEAPDLDVHSSDRVLRRFRYRLTEAGRRQALELVEDGHTS